MVAIISNIVVAIIIIAMVYSAIRALKGSSKKVKKDCCTFCHDSDCSKCKK